MPSISPQTNGPLGADASGVSTDAKFKVGTEFTDDLGTTYRYVKSSAAVGQYKITHTDSSFTMGAEATNATLGATAPRFIVVPQMTGGFTAANQYGWAAVKGPMFVTSLASAVANVVLFAGNSTAGTVDDAGTVKMNNLYLTATVGGATATAAAFANNYITTLP